MTYKVQINDQVRNATPDEIAQIEQIHFNAQLITQAEADAAAAKQSARAKFAALGLTDAEIAALLGA